MVKQAAEKLKPVMSKSAATRSRAGRPYPLTTVSWIDSVNFSAVHGAGIVVATIKSFEAKTYWYVFTIHHIALPLHLLFCPKQGRYHTTKADLLMIYVDTAQNGISSVKG